MSTEAPTTDAEELRHLVATMLATGTMHRPWRRSDTERCHDCNRSNPVWWVQDELWNNVMFAERERVLCPPCFIREAEKVGIGRRGAWQLYPPSPLQ